MPPTTTAARSPTPPRPTTRRRGPRSRSASGAAPAAGRCSLPATPTATSRCSSSPSTPTGRSCGSSCSTTTPGASSRTPAAPSRRSVRPARTAGRSPASRTTGPRSSDRTPRQRTEMTIELVDTQNDRYGNAFLLDDAPDHRLPAVGMPASDAMRLLEEELVLDGIPSRNLATFVTTWMEPEAQRVIAENLHRNYIDHAEYPQTAEIKQRCIRMLADLFHAPGPTTGTRTQGSSEAIMLGALSLKWKWRQRREAAGKDTSRPNLVFGGDVHVV